MQIDKVNKLLDAMISCSLVISSNLYSFADNWSDEEKVDWIKEQLLGCGFDVRDAGGCVWLRIKE